MYAQRTFTRMISGPLTVLAMVWCADRPVGATEPDGATAVLLNRATVPAFDARRTYRQASADMDHHEGHWQNRHRAKRWKIELEATRMVDVVTVLFTVQPGGHGGWHTHPGPAFFTVSEGVLTMYDADDPSCTPQRFPAGTGSLEAGTRDHSHILRNETREVARTVVTFVLPVGADPRVNLPDPGNCAF